MWLSEMVKKVFSAGFNEQGLPCEVSEKSASEPLTKDKLFCAGCNCKEDNHPNVGHHYVGLTSIEDLKSALEEFEELMQADIYSFSTSKRSEDKLIAVGFRVALTHIKKAFPAIYEKEANK